MALCFFSAQQSVQADDLYVSNNGSGDIYKYTSIGAQSTFASGLNSPEGLAFDSEGNLFETDINSNSIIKITPGGLKFTFASGLNSPNALAFDSAGSLFESDHGTNSIMEFTSGGGQSTFASGLHSPQFLAFAPVADTPEPGSLALLTGFVITGFGVVQRRRKAAPRA
jgi:DNA-binding beta-propeller fold protein YncE